MAGLLAATRGEWLRAARCRAAFAAARLNKPEAPAKDSRLFAKPPFPSLALQASGSLLILALLVNSAHAQWPWSRYLRPAAEARVVSTTPHPAIARITVREKDGISFGSGSLVDARGQFGLVVTNWHVVRDATGEITVEFPGGYRTPIKRLLKVDADWDLAALEIERPPGVQPLPIAAALPREQEPLFIAGYGSGDYRVAAGRVKQYVAPKEGMEFEMVEVSVEARQGDSGGPMLNERGEIAGVLWGAVDGSTVGSYGGRVLSFLASIVPDGRPGSDMPLGPGSAAIAQAPRTAPQPTAEHVPNVDPFAALAPQLQDQLQAMAQPPAASPSVPRNVLASPDVDPPRLALVPLPSRRSSPLASPTSPAPPANLQIDQSAITPLTPAELANIAPDTGANLGPEAAAITPADGPPASLPLAPRKGTGEAKPTSLQNAPADQLLAAAWKQIGGTTLLEQAKTVLAAFGLLSAMVFVWRLASRVEDPGEAE